MKEIADFFDSLVPVANAFGWAIVHSFWQGGIIFLLVYSWARLTNSSCTRFNLYFYGLLTNLVCLTVTFFWIFNSATPTAFSSPINYLKREPGNISSMDQFLVNLPEIGAYIKTKINHSVPFLFFIWIAGILVQSLRNFSGLGSLKKIAKKYATSLPDLQQKALNIGREMGIRRIPVVLESSKISVPCTFGFWKPVILFPGSMLLKISANELEMILIHELAHIKRHDYLLNIVQLVMETILFYNPFVKYLSRMSRNERENACDDEVIRCGKDKLNYARLLIAVKEKHLFNPALLALTNNNKGFNNRIKRLFMKPHDPKTNYTSNLLLMGVFFTIIFATSKMAFSDNFQTKSPKQNLTESNIKFSFEPDSLKNIVIEDSMVTETIILRDTVIKNGIETLLETKKIRRYKVGTPEEAIREHNEEEIRNQITKHRKSNFIGEYIALNINDLHGLIESFVSVAIKSTDKLNADFDKHEFLDEIELKERLEELKEIEIEQKLEAMESLHELELEHELEDVDIEIEASLADARQEIQEAMEELKEAKIEMKIELEEALREIQEDLEQEKREFEKEKQEIKKKYKKKKQLKDKHQ